MSKVWRRLKPAPHCFLYRRSDFAILGYIRRMQQSSVGRAVPRKEGRDKVTGKAIYVDDFALDGMLHGVTIRTPCARGRIRGISFGAGIPWEEFTVVTAKDIPGVNAVALIDEEQPYLADGA